VLHLVGQLLIFVTFYIQMTDHVNKRCVYRISNEAGFLIGS